MAIKKTTASQSAVKKTENGLTLNLGIKLTDKTLEAIKGDDGLPSVIKFVARIGETEAMDDSELDLGTAKVKMKDGKEHFMLKNGETFVELEDEHDIEGVVNTIKSLDLPLLLRLVANSIDVEYADEDEEQIFALA